MPSTFPILELKQDGDIAFGRVKAVGAKPTLKDMQVYLKKKAAPTLLTSYAYGQKRLSFFGYTKGKDDELSQHQLPPPFEAGEVEIYGNIILVAHALKQPWDSAIETFAPSDYEVFFEKACSGELEPEEEDAEAADDEEEEAEAEPEVAEEEEEEEAESVNDDEEEEAVVHPAEEEAVEDILPVARASRKAVKVDQQQIQFQYMSTLKPQSSIDCDVVHAVPSRTLTLSVLEKSCADICTEDEQLDLEMGIYNASLEEAKRRLVPLTWDHETFRWIYGMISKRVISNFQPNSYVRNSHLIERWREGEFTLQEIGHWSSYELHPTFWKGLKDQQFRREQRILEGNVAMATDRFRCSRCQKKMTTYYEMQTRSADEPMTIFINCMNCGKQWKQ